MEVFLIISLVLATRSPLRRKDFGNRVCLAYDWAFRKHAATNNAFATGNLGDETISGIVVLHSFASYR